MCGRYHGPRLVDGRILELSAAFTCAPQASDFSTTLADFTTNTFLKDRNILLFKFPNFPTFELSSLISYPNDRYISNVVGKYSNLSVSLRKCTRNFRNNLKLLKKMLKIKETVEVRYLVERPSILENRMLPWLAIDHGPTPRKTD